MFGPSTSLTEQHQGLKSIARNLLNGAICGNATEDECEALREEGIPVLRLPDIKGEDPN
jgi:hypothetical protein